MSIAASRFVSDIREELEGGASLSANWNIILRRAARNLLDKVNPSTLLLRRPVYGSLLKDEYAYYMPSEIATPTALYKNDGKRKWTYVPPSVFFANNPVDPQDRFTVKTLNGVKFLYVRHSSTTGKLAVDAMDSTTGVSGTVTPVLNTHDYLEGSGALQATFTDAGLYFEKTLTSAIDISDYLRGSLLIRANIATASKIASITFRLGTDSSNYYEFTTGTDSLLATLIDGWNFLRFDVANATETGTVTDTSINYWRLTVTTDSGQTCVVIVDGVDLYVTAPLYLEGYSERMFIDGTTGEWKTTVDVDADSVNVEEDVAGLLHYEACLLVQGIGEEKKGEFATQLSRKLEEYEDNHPSDEAPLSYSIIPDLNRRTEPHGNESFNEDIFNSNLD